MFEDIKEHLSNWRSNPRKAQVGFIVSRIWRFVTVAAQNLFGITRPHRGLHPRIETNYVTLLHEQAFESSVVQVKRYTCLDEARLANVWNAVKLAGDGIFVEVGTYRGGTALHICNAIDVYHQAGIKFYSFDPFEKAGFESLRPDETLFKIDEFTDTSYTAVVKLLAAKPNAQVVQGFFPQAAEPFDLRDIAFCHLDVDLYEATLKSLNYLAPRLAAKSVILVDDLGHVATPGVRDAVNYFLAENPSFLLIELFPHQGLLMPLELWWSSATQSSCARDGKNERHSN